MIYQWEARKVNNRLSHSLLKDKAGSLLDNIETNTDITSDVDPKAQDKELIQRNINTDICLSQADHSRAPVYAAGTSLGSPHGSASFALFSDPTTVSL
jgi:hypothetical protein